MKQSFEWRGKIYESECVALEDSSYRLQWQGEQLECSLRPLPDGSWLVQRGARIAKVLVHAAGDWRQVWFEGRTYSLRRLDRRRESGAIASRDAGPLRAEMPCQIVKLRFAAGQWVAQGETLLEMEAMKMELKLNAPHSGRIAEWLVQEGQLVQRGAELLRFEHADESES
ncbi:MAG: acetyl-CoA carboxylase biotin carboxyl carrier protein subunit [Chloroflexi bacterium]|nr:acetyl-CoA carboxylase biotin carboxyl carrier protein subunit [Chloroflexota bacterium]